MSRVADVWANHWPAGFFAAYPPMGELYHRLGLHDRVDLAWETTIERARDRGVERMVVSATAFPGSPVDNAAIARLVRRHPDMLVGCASVDPRRPMAAVRELRRAVEYDGLRALKLLPFIYGMAPDTACYYPLYAACVDLQIPALVLTGHTAVLASNEVGRPGHLDQVALDFPDLTIVAGHAGHPWTEELVALAWKHERLYIDTSGHRPRYFPAPLIQFLNSYGSRKVIFGTGYPLMEPGDALDDLDHLDLRPESAERFLWSNAAKIWSWT